LGCILNGTASLYFAKRKEWKDVERRKVERCMEKGADKRRNVRSRKLRS
jgi:hypothetical protein